jgi:GT2 family glycosyltransferase
MLDNSDGPPESSGNPPMISVIIVNYNGKHLLEECLHSLTEQVFKDFEVILVDNASSDGSVEFVRAAFPKVRVVVERENRGYGGGNNAGIRVSKGKYVVFLNNDTKADSRWLTELFAAAEKDERIGMFASRIMNYYDPGIIDNTGLLMYRDGIARGRGRLERHSGKYAKKDEVFFPSGCAGMYRRNMLDEVGFFDEDFFLYLEDIDIGLRAQLAGWRCLYVPDAVVYHKYSATVGPFSPSKAYLVERNRLWIVFKYFPVSMAIMSFWYALLRYLVQAYGVVAGKGAGSRLAREQSVLTGIKVLVKAYIDGFGRLGHMLAKRKEIMTLKKISTSDMRGLFRSFSIGVIETALKE